MLEELLRGSLDHCVKCTICETACPVSNVTPLFAGPKYTGPQAERYRVADEPSVETSVDYCSGCGICTQVCPQGVKIAEINAQARNKLKRQKGVPLRDRIITRPTWLGRAGTPAAKIANLTIDTAPAADPRREAAEGPPRRAGARLRRAALLALGAQAREPAAPGARSSTSTAAAPSTTSPRRARSSSPSSSTTASRSRSPSRTAAGCRCSPAASSTTRARSCCAWRATSRQHVHDEDTIIVGNATSCTLMLKREAREILDLEDDPDLELVSERTYDICELLLELHDRGELKTDFQPVQDTIAYHAPCQQQGHWIGKPALELLALIPGLQVTEMNARCCGIAGTYGLKAEKYDIAMAVGADLFEQVRASGAATVCVRQRDVPLADRQGHRAPGGAPDRPPAPRLRTLGRAWSASSSSPTARRSPRASSRWRARWAARSSRSRRPAGWTSPGRWAPTPSGCARRSSARCPTTACSCSWTSAARS